jgi:nucleoside triphosphatase
MALVKCRTLFNETKFVPPESMIHRPSVYGIVLDGQRVLLGKAKTTQKYVLPGGGINPGETMDEALKREMWEETGLYVGVGEFLHFETDFFFYDPWEQAFHGFLFFYHCTTAATDLNPIDYPPIEDLDLAEWVSIADLRVDSFQARGELTLKLIERCMA